MTDKTSFTEASVKKTRHGSFIKPLLPTKDTTVYVEAFTLLDFVHPAASTITVSTY